MKISDIENTQDFLISVSFLVESVYFFDGSKDS